ncbi:iron(III) transport system permease protein [Hydrogenispora ethanolica]|uniref:Iron(III) transport system permease protein n=1 Tax=Hydrogenispora ethanolica TaxID=1082276 RepID=A0A4R1R8W3_HYDET|nr:iron(III) transport system permease protein [Hydrogenispora ethanolica]
MDLKYSTMAAGPVVNKKRISDPLITVAIILIWLSLLIFIVYPLARSLWISLVVDGKLSLAHYGYVFTHQWLLTPLYNSLGLGVLVATLSTIIGFGYAYGLNRTNMPAKGIFRQLALLPVISPPFMFALSVILLLGKNGLITKLLGLTHFDIYGLPGLVLVQSLTMFPIAYLVLDGVLKAINPDMEDSAFNLGATRFQVFSTVTLPLALPGIASAWLLVFVTSLADFGNPMVLGGGFDVLSVQAYLQVTGMFNVARGATLAVILLVPAMIAFYLQRYWIAKRSYVTVTGKPTSAGVAGVTPVTKWLLTAFASLLSLTILGFYAVIIYGCFVKLWGYNWSFTLENFTYAWDIGKDSMMATVTMAGIATAISGILAMVVAFLMVRKDFFGKKAMGFVTLMGYAVPGTLVGIGYIQAFNSPPLMLTGTMWIIVFCFIFREIPVGIESGVATLNQIDPAIEEASSNLGADSRYTFTHVTLPLIKSAFFASLAYSFVRSMTAVSAVIFLVTARWYHLTALVLSQTEIMRLGAASVLSLFTIIIVMLAFVIIRWCLGSSANSAPRIGG